MIKTGKINEAYDDGEISRFMYRDYKEMDPNDYDEGQVEDWIGDFEKVAKLLGVDKSKMVQITEENPRYDKLIKFAKGKGTPVKNLSIDGQAGLWTIGETKMITTNEWGYGTIYISLADEKILLKKKFSLNESKEPMTESAKIRNMTKMDAQGYDGNWQLPSGKPGMSAEAGDLELIIVGDSESVQIMLQNDDGDLWFKAYPASQEKAAVVDFKKITADLSDLVDAAKLAKKYGLKGV